MHVTLDDRLRVSKIILDGIEDITNRCFEADDEAGFAHCYKRNSEGNFYLDSDGLEAAKEILTGQIKIIFKDEVKHEN